MCEWLLSKSLTFVFLLLTQKDEKKKKGGRTKKKKKQIREARRCRSWLADWRLAEAKSSNVHATTGKSCTFSFPLLLSFFEVNS